MIWKMFPLQKNLIKKGSLIAVRNIFTGIPLKKNLYETLRLTEKATAAEIKQSYFELSKLYHPDRIEATDDNLAKFREITTAYEILSNEQSRKLYDRGLLKGITKPTEDAHSEVVDPIVQFYKKRQDFSKEILKPVEEIKSWTPPLRKYANSPVSQKYDYYKKPGTMILYRDNILRYDYLFLVGIIISAYLLVNCEGSNLRERYKRLVGIED